MLSFFVLPGYGKDAISYNRDVRPILSENCFFCHGFDKEKREADLRLDTRAGALESKAIVPAEPNQSELIARIFSKDEDDHMPPLDSAYRLTVPQKQTLVQWIKEGAQYEEHWSFQKLTRPHVPGSDAHPIDSFLKRTWKENDVEPVTQTDPRTLLRRLSYDLRGLPPTHQEVAAFVADPSPAHYQKFLDQWLTSTEHAEHQGLLWLDLVRHADSNGMVSDEPIATGPFRKYVIEAFRDNMPFDQFTREQLAGDLLPNRTDRSLTASAYNRLVKTNCEAGVYEPGDRRVSLHYLHDKPEDSQKEHQLIAQIDEVRKKLYQAKIDPAALKVWKTEIFAQENAEKAIKGEIDWPWFPALLPVAHITEGDYTQTETGRQVIAQPGEIKEHRCIETYTTAGTHHYFAHLTIDPGNKPEFVAIQLINGAYRRMGWHPNYFRTYYWGPKDHPAALKHFPRKPVHMGPLPKAGEMVRLQIPKATLGSAPYVPQGMAWIQQGGTITWGSSGYPTSAHGIYTRKIAESTLRYFWELPFNRDDRKDFHKLIFSSLKSKSPRPIHTTIIEMTFREHQNPKLTTQLNDLYRQAYLHRQGATKTLVSKIGPPKKTHILTRGNFMDESGPLAHPAIPERFGKLSTENPTRLDLANWIISQDNPLTARVFVNRLWHQFYGRGISETLEDSGNQGNWPSHVKLLDWLATEFRSDWNIRKMIRLMVTSEAYQLSSVPGSLLAQKDPTNRLHARQGRSRHTAEEIRDSALLAAGLLQKTTTIPSQSFFPYQPAAYWAKSNKVMFGSRYQIWEPSQGPTQYQRSLYTFWKRQNIHPAMLALDAPTRQECTAMRPITNTPAQALALLNDPQFVEAANHLAIRALAAPDKHLNHLFQFALQRNPTNEEKTELNALIIQMSEHFKKHPEEAKQLTSVGQKKTTSKDLTQEAAWSTAARVVLNLHEFLTRN